MIAHRPKILIVDDRHENLLALKLLLADLDIDIIEADNGNDALAATIHNQFALAILDVMMPGMDGYELATLMQGDKKTSTVPIIFVTAFCEDELQMFKGYEAGCIDYIVKPYNPEIMLGKVRMFLEMDRYREELRNHHAILESLVTERTAELMQRVDEIRTAEQLWQTTFNAMDDGVLLLDRDKKILQCNQALCELTGKSEEQIVGVFCHQLLCQELCMSAKCPHANALKHIQPFRKTTTFQERQLQISANPVAMGPGNRFDVVMVLRDITAQVVQEKRLLKRYDGQKLLAEISAEMNHCQSAGIDHAIEKAMGRIGRFANSDRGYVFLINEQQKMLSNSHEWCAPGIEAQIDNLQNLPLELFDWTMKKLNHFEYIFIPSVSEIPPEGNVEKEALEAQDIQSLLLVPLTDQTQLYGFLGLDWVRTKTTIGEDFVHLLLVMGDILWRSLNRVWTDVRLRESNERKELALDGANLGSWDWDIDSGKVTFDQRWAEMLGYSLDELEPHVDTWKNLLHPDDLEQVMLRLNNHLEGQNAFYNCEFRMQSKSGQLIWIQDRGRVTERDANGKPLRAAGTHQDITEAKRSQKLLHQREQEYRLLVENQTDLVVKIGVDGRIKFASPSYCRMFGKDPKLVLGSLFAPPVHEDDINASRRAMQDIYSPPYTTHLEQRVMTVDGWRWLEWVNTGVLDDKLGQVSAIVGVGRDISARKKAEEEKEKIEAQFYQAQKMESIGLLAGGIAHDFNNLLTTIIGNVDLVLMDMGKDAPEIDLIREVRKAGRKASLLTSQLLAFSRKQIRRPEVTNMNDIVQDMEKMFQRILGGNIVLKSELVQDLRMIEVDIGQMEQMLMNLAVNGRDAMQDGGSLIIRTENIVIDTTAEDNTTGLNSGPHVLLTVEDTGTGIAPEHLSQLFEPFFTTKEKGKGTGLGLSTIYGIVQQNNGCILVDSELGSGTTFRVYFPATEAQAPLPEKICQEPSPRGMASILVVEDDARLRKMAISSLHRFGYSTLDAGNGKEALKLLQEQHENIDAILTDIVMPEMGGIELVHQVREIYPTLKVVFMSGHTEDAGERGILEDRHTFFLQKPFGHEELIRHIRKVTETPPLTAPGGGKRFRA